MSMATASPAGSWWRSATSTLGGQLLRLPRLQRRRGRGGGRPRRRRQGRGHHRHHLAGHPRQGVPWRPGGRHPQRAGFPKVRVVDGLSGFILSSFMAYPPTLGAGVRVGTFDFNGDGRADLITGAAGNTELAHVFDGPSVLPPFTPATLDDFFAFETASPPPGNLRGAA